MGIGEHRIHSENMGGREREGQMDEGSGSGQARKRFQIKTSLRLTPQGALQRHSASRQRGFCTLGQAVIGHPGRAGGMFCPGKEGSFSGKSCRYKPFTMTLTAAGAWTSSWGARRGPNTTVGLLGKLAT